jgi:tripeptidyl-peptidase I
MLFIAGIFTALASVASSRLISSFDSAPAGWTKHQSPATTDVVRLQIALSQQHGASRLGEIVLGISTPGSESYGKHLSAKEVQFYTAPTEDTKTAVLEWLAAHSFEDIQVNHDTVTIVAQASVADVLLNTTFNWYENTFGRRVLRTLQYSVPDSLIDSIDMVRGTHHLYRCAVLKPSLPRFNLLPFSVRQVIGISKDLSIWLVPRNQATC